MSVKRELVAMHRRFDSGLAAALMGRAKDEGKDLSGMPVRLWEDDRGALHSEICTVSMTPQVTTLAVAADLLGRSAGSWCECGGVAGVSGMQLLQHLDALWCVVDGMVPEAESWFHLARQIEDARPALAPTSVEMTSLYSEFLLDLAERARAAMLLRVRADGRRLAAADLAGLLVMLSAPALRVTVDPDEAELLARWGQAGDLARTHGAAAPPSARLPAAYGRFDAAARRRLRSRPGSVLVDAGPVRGVGLPVQVLVYQPTAAAVIFAAGLADVHGGRLWLHLPVPAAEGAARWLRLPKGRVLGRDVTDQRVLETAAALMSHLVDPLPLDDVLMLAEEAL